jgi:predicted glycosyltransferase
MILCGHREAGSIVPENCEYVRLPSLNIPLSKGSRGVFWGRRSPFTLALQQAIGFRKKLIDAVIRGFAPDVIVVENRPLGMMEELDGVLQTSRASKVFLTRGIMTTAHQVRSHYLSARQELALSDGTFAKVIVAADQKVWDLATEYDLSPEIAARLEYVGYFSKRVEREAVERTRAERGVRSGVKWIVCSAGGGALGERVIEEFTYLADRFGDAAIDIIRGPHTSLAWEPLLRSTIGDGRLRLHRECPSLPLLHAAADVVVCPGGYNSLVEVMEGGAPIVVVPVQPEGHGEQYLHASRLAAHYPIRISTRPNELADLVADVLNDAKPKITIRERATLRFDGLENARDLILDLGRPGQRLTRRGPAEIQM